MKILLNTLIGVSLTILAGLGIISLAFSVLHRTFDMTQTDKTYVILGIVGIGLACSAVAFTCIRILQKHYGLPVYSVFSN